MTAFSKSLLDEANRFLKEGKTAEEWADWIEDFANMAYDFLNEDERVLVTMTVGDAQFYDDEERKDDHDMNDVVMSMICWMEG